MAFDPEVGQLAASGKKLGAQIDLIPPYSDEFIQWAAPAGYAGKIGEQCQQWAQKFEYMMCIGPAMRCVHGLYRMDVCASIGRPGRGCDVGLDHARVWISDNGMGAFILAHLDPQSHVPNTIAKYAEAHSLDVRSYAFDGWYPGKTPVRLSIPSGWPMWPIQRDAVVLLASQPIQWPTKEQRVSSND
jgi:hypothetical protein